MNQQQTYKESSFYVRWKIGTLVYNYSLSPIVRFSTWHSVESKEFTSICGKLMKGWFV